MFTAKQTQAPTARVSAAHAPDLLRRSWVQRCGDTSCDCAHIQHGQPKMAQVPVQAPPSIRRVISGEGQPLDEPFRTQAEARLGFDFSSVRIHANTEAADSAQEIGAVAYTAGNHIVFANGRFPPTTGAGMRLLNHELTHVAQQRAMTPAGELRLGPEHDAAEVQAEAFAVGTSRSVAASPEPAGVVRRQTSAPERPAAEPLRTQPPPDATPWDRFWSQRRMLERMFQENRYGCWCGPGHVCREVRDPIDACCKAHDKGYDRQRVSSTPGPGEIDMWSAEGFVRTAGIDQALVDCTQAAQSKDLRLGTAELYVDGVELIFGTRVRIASAIQTARTIASIPSTLGKLGRTAGEQLFVRPVLVARATVDPANWDLGPLARQPRDDLAVVGAYLWSKLRPDDLNAFAAHITEPLSRHAIPRSLLESICRGASAAASQATGWTIELRPNDLLDLNPVVFVQTLHDWKALRYRTDPRTTADAQLAKTGQANR